MLLYNKIVLFSLLYRLLKFIKFFFTLCLCFSISSLVETLENTIDFQEKCTEIRDICVEIYSNEQNRKSDNNANHIPNREIDGEKDACKEEINRDNRDVNEEIHKQES